MSFLCLLIGIYCSIIHSFITHFLSTKQLLARPTCTIKTRMYTKCNFPAGFLHGIMGQIVNIQKYIKFTTHLVVKPLAGKTAVQQWFSHSALQV